LASKSGNQKLLAPKGLNYVFHPCKPDGLLPMESMEQELLAERGRKLYKLRGQTVEPVFGQIKDARGFGKFMRRGIEACKVSGR